MKNNMIVGIVLLVLGIAVLGYGQLNYKTRDTVLEIGPIKATAETTHTVPLPSILGWVLVAGGVGVLVFSGRKA